jgi:hypothetical protein
LTERTPLKIPRGATATVEILAGNNHPLTRSELIAAAGEPVRTAISGTCLWDLDAWLGDYRYVVFSTSPKKHVDVFIQLWSEPGEPAIWQICSGQFDKLTASWLPKDLGDRAERLGFSLGNRSQETNQPQNYSKHVTIRKRDVASIAQTVLELFHDLFGYRGLTTLGVRIEYGTRAAERPVYSSFTPEDICKIASGIGCSAEIVAGSQGARTCAIALRKGRVRAEVILGDREKDRRLYASGIVGASNVPALVRAGAQHALKRYGLGGQRKQWRIGVTISFEGGVTTDWVAGRIRSAMDLIAQTNRDSEASKKARLPSRKVH